MSELDERQVCLGCKKRINLLIDGYRCRDCPFFFCGPCADYHFGRTDVSPVTGKKDAMPGEIQQLRARVAQLEEALRVSYRALKCGVPHKIRRPDCICTGCTAAETARAALDGRDEKGKGV